MAGWVRSPFLETSCEQLAPHGDNLSRLADWGDVMRRAHTAVLVLLLGTLASAQDGAKVLIPLIVTDYHQRLVSGLTPASLVISESKVPLKDINLLRGSDLPLELGLVIDTWKHAPIVPRSRSQHCSYSDEVELPWS